MRRALSIEWCAMEATDGNPVCPCGYDLSGLAGPPWRCPECDAVTTEWPPPSEPYEVPPTERRILGWSIGIGVTAAALAPWLLMPQSDFGLIIATCLIFIANIAALFYAATLALWIARNVPGWRKVLAIIPFLCYSAFSLIVVWTAFFMSMTIRD